MKTIIYISKDALNKNSLPTYGNKFWKTPNIDELATKGTVFNRHYTAGGSTAMAFTSMALGKYCFETPRKDYHSETPLNGDTIFDKLYDVGYECHIVWDDDLYTPFAKKHFLCEGFHTKIHGVKGLKQPESSHIVGQFDDVSWNDEETKDVVRLVTEEFKRIQENAEKDLFIWLHLPHVLRGRQGYGSDIDVFDEIIGVARSMFGDESIFISADHGHMNGSHGRFHYGFDVGEDVICIPLITPKVNDREIIDFPTSSLQMLDIFLNKKVSPLEYVMSETSYYAQPKRKIAVIKGKYKYCFDKEGKKESLFDLEEDPMELRDLAHPEHYDVDRFIWYSTAQCFYYPYWEDAQRMLVELRAVKDSVWRNGTAKEEMVSRFVNLLRCIYNRNIKKILKRKSKTINITGH